MSWQLKFKSYRNSLDLCVRPPEVLQNSLDSVYDSIHTEIFPIFLDFVGGLGLTLALQLGLEDRDLDHDLLPIPDYI